MFAYFQYVFSYGSQDVQILQVLISGYKANTNLNIKFAREQAMKAERGIKV